MYNNIKNDYREVIIKIIGIDPGTHITGYGLIDVKANDIVYRGHGVFKTRPKDPVAKRLQIIGDKFEKLLLKFQPDIAVLEKSFVGHNPRTAIALGEAKGMLLYILTKHHIAVKEFATCVIKKGISGNGRASKEHICHLMLHILKTTNQMPQKLDTLELDATDALATAFYYGKSFNLQLKTQNFQ